MEDAEIKVTVVPSVNAEPALTEGKQKIIANNKRKVHHSNHLIIGMLGCFGVFAWIVFFSLGMLIDSSQYRNTLSTDFTLHKFIMTMITFTPSNIAILCLVSAFTGGCASLLVITKAKKTLGLDDELNHNKTNSQIYMSENPFSSMMRGILVFFAFLAGVFITSSNALSAPTAQAYTQAAGVVSMLAFIVGYDPTMFKTLISISEKIKGKD
jgi:hypothetical protein